MTKNTSMPAAGYHSSSATVRLRCCVKKGSEYGVSEWIGDKLARLAGLDSEEAKAAQLKQRINRLIADLKMPDADDRRTAAALSLGHIGLVSREATDALIIALDDPDEFIRRAVIEAIVEINPVDERAAPALIEKLEDEDESVREYAAKA